MSDAMNRSAWICIPCLQSLGLGRKGPVLRPIGSRECMLCKRRPMTPDVDFYPIGDLIAAGAPAEVFAAMIAPPMPPGENP